MIWGGSMARVSGWTIISRELSRDAFWPDLMPPQTPFSDLATFRAFEENIRKNYAEYIFAHGVLFPGVVMITSGATLLLGRPFFGVFALGLITFLAYVLYIHVSGRNMTREAWLNRTLPSLLTNPLLPERVVDICATFVRETA
jgi:hypothetical protein